MITNFVEINLRPLFFNKFFNTRSTKGIKITCFLIIIIHFQYNFSKIFCDFYKMTFKTSYFDLLGRSSINESSFSNLFKKFVYVLLFILMCYHSLCINILIN